MLYALDQSSVQLLYWSCIAILLDATLLNAPKNAGSNRLTNLHGYLRPSNARYETFLGGD
jgi:hypothetical protein